MLLRHDVRKAYTSSSCFSNTLRTDRKSPPPPIDGTILSETLVSTIRKEEQGGRRTSDSCVPDRQWMTQVHLDAAALDQHDVYIFTSQWVPSIPPSPWWPEVTASWGPQPLSNYHLSVFSFSIKDAIKHIIQTWEDEFCHTKPSCGRFFVKNTLAHTFPFERWYSNKTYAFCINLRSWLKSVCVSIFGLFFHLDSLLPF